MTDQIRSQQPAAVALAEAQANGLETGSSLSNFALRKEISLTSAYALVRDGKLAVSKIGGRTVVLASQEREFDDRLKAEAEARRIAASLKTTKPPKAA